MQSGADVGKFECAIQYLPTRQDVIEADICVHSRSHNHSGTAVAKNGGPLLSPQHNGKAGVLLYGRGTVAARGHAYASILMPKF